MTKTEHYQLNQWDAADRVLRQDFNADNRKIDAALPWCKVYTYIGTGEYKHTSPSSLTFPERPMLALLYASEYMVAIPGFLERHQNNVLSTSNISQSTFSWDGSTLLWYNSNNAKYQFNESGVTYYCLAIFAPHSTEEIA